MREKVIDTSRLRDSGWDSFRPELMLNEPARQTRDESDFFVKLLEDYSKGKRVLEVCCGGGKLLIQLARVGFEMVGIDLNARILEICRRAVTEEPPEVQNRIRLVPGDMCTFELCQEFDFIILEDDAFVLPLTQDDQISCLKAINRHLKKEGYLVLCCTTPQKELKSKGARGYDPVRQIKTVQYEWDTLDDGGNPQTVREGWGRFRFVYPNELELLLKIAGLEPVERWGDNRRSPFVNPAEQDYCYLIRKT